MAEVWCYGPKSCTLLRDSTADGPQRMPCTLRSAQVSTPPFAWIAAATGMIAAAALALPTIYLHYVCRQRVGEGGRAVYRQRLLPEDQR